VINSQQRGTPDLHANIQIPYFLPFPFGIYTGDEFCRAITIMEQPQETKHNIFQNEEYEMALAFINCTNASVFLTGKAGTGKTTFLGACKKNERKNTVVVAPTGVAAINAGGTTIHSFFQLPLATFLPGIPAGPGAENSLNPQSLISRIKLTSGRREILQKLELLIIDEVSMVRCDLLDAVDTVLRHVRKDHHRPFGGVQLLLIGDLYQLPPVIQKDEWGLLSNYYKSPFFFSSYAVGKLEPICIELETIYRQKDPVFIRLLNAIRNNMVEQEMLNVLHTRYLPGFEPARDENYIVLTTHNRNAGAINFSALDKLVSEEKKFTATIEGEFSERSFPADNQLILKEGAQVMFIKNDTEKPRRFYNGKIGIVEKIEDDAILVKCTGEPSLIEVKKEVWFNVQYKLDKDATKVEEHQLGSFTQFPLGLAWAITIHKSQGLTFEKAVIDAGEAFAPGQVYVALSRCKSLEGIILQSRISDTSFRCDPRIIFYSGRKKRTADLYRLLDGAKAQYQKEILHDLFEMTEIFQCSQSLIIYAKGHPSFFDEEAHNYLEVIHDKILLIDTTATKFRVQLDRLLMKPVMPQNNPDLQERICAAAKHFTNALSDVNLCLNTNPIRIDHKVIAIDFDKVYETLFHQIHTRVHLFQICQQGFNVANFLKGKREYSKPEFPWTTYVCIAPKNKHPKFIHAKLYELLKRERETIYRKKSIPPYKVPSTKILTDICYRLPRSEEELCSIAGSSNVWFSNFGSAFLEITRRYCEENDVRSNEPFTSHKRIHAVNNRSKKNDTKSVTHALFMTGKSIEAIASDRQLSESTVEGHLLFLIKKGKLKVSNILTKEQQDLISEALIRLPGATIKKLKENLPCHISYNAIRMFIAGKETPEI
jgi:hypothetical protein